MAATNETTNYGLPQWESTDKPEMADFNQAMSDIDSNLNLVQGEIGTLDGWDYVKYPNGLQECWGMFELPYISTTECLFNASLPSNLTWISDYEPNIQISHRSESNVTRDKVTGVRASHSSPPAWGTVLMRALSSGGGFTSSSYVRVFVRVIGRWN